MSAKLFLIMLWQKESMVDMEAPAKSIICRCSLLIRALLGGVFSSSWAIAFCSRWPIRSLISAAAALVKVTTSSSSTLQGFSASCIFSSKGRSKWLTTRSTSTAVLPEPAAADTNIFLSSRSIACCCSLVQPIRFPPYQLDCLSAETALLQYSP